MTYRIQTGHSKDGVLQTLRDNTGQEGQITAYRNTPRPYYGEIGADDFRISSDVQYSGIFVPVMEGKVEGSSDSAVVSLRMKMGQSVKGLLRLLTIMFGVLLLIMAFSVAMGTMQPLYLALPVGLIALIYAVVMLYFKFEAAKSKNEFVKLLTA